MQALILQSGTMEFENGDVGNTVHLNQGPVLRKSVWKPRIWTLTLLKVFVHRHSLESLRVPWVAHTPPSPSENHEAKNSLAPRLSHGLESLWKMPQLKG